MAGIYLEKKEKGPGLSIIKYKSTIMRPVF
jgi:hypothetical protein